MTKKKFVTIFGSSIPQPGEAEYECAFQLGLKLAQNNINVCSGGFQGIMDAVSKGARKGGAETVGVTLDIYNVQASKFLSQEIKCHTLFDRLKNLIEIGDAYVVLQGGTGTLLELALVWEYMNKNMISIKPIACHSSLWEGIVDLMEEQIMKERRKTGLIKCFTEIDECADYIISSI